MSLHPVAPETPEDHVRGPKQQPHDVTIIEYGDYECPHTRACQEHLNRLQQENPGIKLVYRHFPLTHLHSDAEGLARITEAAERVKGAFWPMHERLMAQRGAIDEHAVAEMARAVGLELRELMQWVERSEVHDRVTRDIASGRASGVHSTPSFFFNGVLHDGSYDFETLKGKVEQARGP